MKFLVILETMGAWFQSELDKSSLSLSFPIFYNIFNGLLEY